MFMIVLDVKETHKLLIIAYRVNTNMFQTFMHDFGHVEKKFYSGIHARGYLSIDDSLKKSEIRKYYRNYSDIKYT